MAAPRWALPLLGVTAALGGCGGGAARYANTARPPSTTDVAAAITPTGISLFPDHLGAGVVHVVVSNLTARSQKLTLRATGPGAFEQQTAPIDPAATAELKAQLPAGSYAVSVSQAGLPPATLAVGRPGSSAQDQLLLP